MVSTLFLYDNIDFEFNNSQSTRSNRKFLGGLNLATQSVESFGSEYNDDHKSQILNYMNMNNLGIQTFDKNPTSLKKSKVAKSFNIDKNK